MLRRISMIFQARFPSQPIQLFSHQVGLKLGHPEIPDPYDHMIHMSYMFHVGLPYHFPHTTSKFGLQSLKIFRPRQLHLQMEGLDRPKVGEWRDTKGFYGASIPLAWAQAWTTRSETGKAGNDDEFSDTNRKPHKIKHKIKQPEKWMMILEYLGTSWGVRYPKSSFKPVWKNLKNWIIPSWE